MVMRKILAGLCALVLCVSSVVYAADTEVILDSSSSSSGFTIKNSSLNDIFRAGGDGIITFPGNKVITDSTNVLNTFLGANAGNSNTSGSSNTAYGSSALKNNTTGSGNTAIGQGTLRDNIAGTSNTAVGNSALVLSNGSGNIAVGARTLQNNTTGNSNVATGVEAMFFNTTGGQNVANGSGALKDNLTAWNNTAIGNRALNHNTTGASNTAIGAVALLNNLTGSSNIAIGSNAGVNATGSGNIFLGVSSGFSQTTGDNKLHIGLGNNTLISGDFSLKRVGIGILDPSTLTHPLEMSSGAHVTSGGAWTNASSRDYKENIQNLSVKNAFETLDGLRPVTFKYKTEESEKYVGFIAEDVPELVATQDRKGLSPMDITAVLTKVVQEQQKIISELSAKVKSLEDRI